MPIVLERPDPIAPIIPNPDTDYASLAEANWAEAQLGAHRLREVATELLQLAGREARGKQWLSKNVDDPQWAEAVRLHQRIGLDLNSAQVEMVATERRVWQAVCSTYVAVRMARKSGNLSEKHHNAPGRALGSKIVYAHIRPYDDLTDDSSASALWHSLVGGRQPPGSFPLEMEDVTVTAKAWPYSVPGWQLEELDALLKKGRRG